jgi:ubiquinol-cytochrome c reductase cytochrome c1 subunit
MLRKLLALAALSCALVGGQALAATTQQEPAGPAGGWKFSGPLGMYDQAQLQRGFKVYTEVCSQCHALSLISFGDLGAPGGPFYNPKYQNPNDNPVVKAVALGWPRKVADIDPDTGDATHRDSTTADAPAPPFPNEAAARASNGGALPPDMSLLVAAREGGPNYVYTVVQGYRPTPTRIQGAPAGKYYNIAYPGDLTSLLAKGDTQPAPIGGFISMPPPLTDCKVKFDDGSPCDVKHEAADIAAFLTWASDPKMEERKQTGLAVMAYLLVFSGLLYASYRRVWRNVAH